MARAKRQSRREKGTGTITERANGRFYLMLRVGDRAYQRAIANPDTGEPVRTMDDAIIHAPTLASAIRAEATRSLSGEPIENLAKEYQRFLPTHAKNGLPHPEATGQQPLAPSTLSGNLFAIRRFVAWMTHEYPKVTRLDGITRVHAAAYMASLAHLSPNTYNRRLAELIHVFAVIPCPSNPFASLDYKGTALVDRERVGKRPFTPEELAIMQERATGWIRPAMLLSFHTGFRLGDVVTLRWTEIDGDGFIRRVQRKSGKEETLYCPEIVAELDAWRRAQGDAAGEYVFPQQAKAYLGIGRKHRDPTLPVVQFRVFLQHVCGFTTTDASGHTVLGFHSLRTSNATYGRRAGETVAEVQKRLAHSDASITAGYIQLTDADVRRELKATHRPLALPAPGAKLATDRAEDADRERLASLAWSLPIAEVRRVLAKVTKGGAR